MAGTCASIDTASLSVRTLLAMITRRHVTITTASAANQLPSLQDRQLLKGKPKVGGLFCWCQQGSSLLESVL